MGRRRGIVGATLVAVSALCGSLLTWRVFDDPYRRAVVTEVGRKLNLLTGVEAWSGRLSPTPSPAGPSVISRQYVTLQEAVDDCRAQVAVSLVIGQGRDINGTVRLEMTNKNPHKFYVDGVEHIITLGSAPPGSVAIIHYDNRGDHKDGSERVTQGVQSGNIHLQGEGMPRRFRFGLEAIPYAIPVRMRLSGDESGPDEIKASVQFKTLCEFLSRATPEMTK